MRKIRRDDMVKVLSGKEKNKQGQVREVLVGKERVIVTGLNMIKRHTRQQGDGQPAGIIEKESPIHVSNVQLICRFCQKPTHVTFRVRTDGAKVRVCKKCNEDID